MKTESGAGHRRQYGRASWVCLLLAIGLSGFPLLGWAEGEAIIFPALKFAQQFQERQIGDVDMDHVEASADLFATYDQQSFRFLGEYFLHQDVPHLERFQLGWMLRPETTLWLGRFHTPLGYWNTRFHHGKYLQTTISQPAIEAFEHSGGILPLHTTGLYLEGTEGMLHGDLHYTFSFGLGPEFAENGAHAELLPLDFIPPGENRHGLSANLRLSYRPHGDGRLENGMFFGQSQMPGTGGAIEDVDQSVFGVFLNQEWSGVHSTLSATMLHHCMKTAGGGAESSIVAGYLQVQRSFANGWTPYVRLEHVPNARHDAYLSRFPALPRQRELLGLRLDLSPRQALKLEISDTRTQDRRLGQFALEWSAVYP